jgi:hypothetical protein
MVDELNDLHARIRSRLTARLFDVPIMQNQDPLYVEAMTEEAPCRILLVSTSLVALVHGGHP